MLKVSVGMKLIPRTSLFCRYVGKGVRSRCLHVSRIRVKRRMWDCGVKTRVAPLDKQTIPRLELLSNLTASRLVKSASQALENVVKVDDVVNWTDSMIPQWWNRNNDKEYKQFVENRVNEIRRNAPPERWRYCPTSENPADIVSTCTLLLHTLFN